MIYSDIALTTLEAVLAQQGGADVVNTTEDQLLIGFIAAASDMVHQFCRRSFVPYVQTRYYDAIGEHIDGVTLYLDEDLLEVSAITNGDGTTITSSQYTLRDRNVYPRWAIRLKSGWSWLYDGSDFEEEISVAGTWGFHESYESAWISTGDSVQDAVGINATTTTITVGDADGKDTRYRTRFEVGKLLKVEDEFMVVVAIDTDTLTVRRGVLGTTAASHDKDTTISSWVVQRNIEQAVISLAQWLYRNRKTAGDELQFMDGRHVILNKAPSNIRQVLDDYVRLP